MNIMLYEFSRSLDPKALQSAISLKQKLEDAGHPPKHFRVSARNLWSKSFKHADVAGYTYVRERLADLDIAEKNLNRNIDSKAQLELFLATASEVKTQFLKRYGAQEF